MPDALTAPFGIEHVFVLMLENRSFDHMLGFSGISGVDAETGVSTGVRGLTGNESNLYNGQVIPVAKGANMVMPTDPGHEFADVLHQLCGPAASYTAGGNYPPVDNSGFVASYVACGGLVPGEVMRCYAPGQLPVLNALAREFVVCDNWHASLPGPTWPNRMFVHAASSGGLDHSPSVLEIANWEALAGFEFENGTIFDRLVQNGIRRRIYGGDDFPMVAALKGIGLGDVRHYSLFAGDVAAAGYADQYIFIEPSYDVFHHYQGGTSQHPLGDVTKGEALIKATYEAIRNSPAWDSSLLIITWDEHGGFYDHDAPGFAVPPGDAVLDATYNQNGFTFDQYGVRVPALVISPRIPRNLVDHRDYDHSSIPATLETLFGMAPMTARDAAANPLSALVTLAEPRRDAPQYLPNPAPELVTPPDPTAAQPTVAPAESANKGNVPAIIHAAMQQDIAAAPQLREMIVERVKQIQTRADARQYLREVQARVIPIRTAVAQS